MASPFDKRFLGCFDSVGFHLDADFKSGFAIPLPPHPGGFGTVRRHHVHEGVDIYCLKGEHVLAMDDCDVMSVEPFTGPAAGFPWWLDTMAVTARRKSDGIVFVYGEISPNARPGQTINEGETIGFSIPVLKNPKGYPECMLHIESYEPASNGTCGIWGLGEPRPAGILDPTPLILAAIRRNHP